MNIPRSPSSTYLLSHSPLDKHVLFISSLFETSYSYPIPTKIHNKDKSPTCTSVHVSAERYLTGETPSLYSLMSHSLLLIPRLTWCRYKNPLCALPSHFTFDMKHVCVWVREWERESPEISQYGFSVAHADRHFESVEADIWSNEWISTKNLLGKSRQILKKF